MNKHILPFALLLLVCPAAARAQVSVHIDLGLPPVPRLVLVQPGIQVVEGFQEEVFFHSGWYWCRRSDGWYRARSPRARFECVEVRRVPAALVRVPVGHYRNWYHEPKAHERREEMHERREEHRIERKEEHRAERKEDRWEERHNREKRGREKDEKEHGHRER